MSTNPRVFVLYNTDYDEELAATSVDVSEVRAAALAVHKAISEYGFAGELHGVHGRDVDQLFATLRDNKPDLVFNLCESLYGDTQNEVVIPAILDMLGVPYTGPGPWTIATCLHKNRCKDVLIHKKIPTPLGRVIEPSALSNPAEFRDLAYPMFLKLAREDASIGIEASNRVNNEDQLVHRCREMFASFHQPVLAESFIEGREINVTLLGNGDTLRVLPLHEIDFSKMPADRPRVLTYAAKWDEKHVDYAGSKPVPMLDVSPAIESAVVAAAKRTFTELELRDFGRVDVRLDAQGTPWVIDVNPNCDLSPDAGFARAAKASGLDYSQVIGAICEAAWQRRKIPAA